MAITERDRTFLRRAIDLAEESLATGDEPFGTILVLDGRIRFEDRNRAVTVDVIQHPELTAVHWALAHLDAAERARAEVFTSGEHCPMCAAAHGWAGLGRIVYASSGAQLGAWARELGLPAMPVAALGVADVIPGVHAEGPDEELSPLVRALHARRPR